MAKKTGDSLGEKKIAEGICYDALSEPVPLFNARDGDGVITGRLADGRNNNAWIVMGRDRQDDACSGYGGVGNQKAGAIDIVVGRMAPVPLANFPGDKKDKIYVDPIYKSVVETRLSADEYKAMNWSDKLLEDIDEGAEPKPANFKGVYMDAARIYISQKSDIDYYFGLSPGLRVQSPKKGESPRSAIAMKADGVRVIAREGIKLVTMGAHGANMGVWNSQGGKINATQGIELIAGNGYDNNGNRIEQEPLVKGYKLAEGLRELAGDIAELAGILATFAETQLNFNSAVMSHNHGSFFLGSMTTTSPTATIAGMQNLTNLISRVQVSIIGNKGNKAGWVNKYASKGNAKIYSNYNTTN